MKPFCENIYYPFEPDQAQSSTSFLTYPWEPHSTHLGMAHSNRGVAFKFRTRHETVDWRRIGAIDVDKVVNELNFETLQDNLINITFCNLENETCPGCHKSMDPLFLKLFRLAQLTIEYLLHSQEYLTSNIQALDKTVQVTLSEAEGVKIKMAKQEEELKTLKVECKHRKRIIAMQQMMICSGANSSYKCHHCNKAFINHTYLQNHIERRHPDEVICGKPQLDSSEILQREINQLKEELANSSKVLNHSNASHLERIMLENEQRKTIEEEFICKFDVWKTEEKDKQEFEMEKVKWMFMKEIKELNAKNRLLEKELQQIKQEKQFRKSGLGVLQESLPNTKEHKSTCPLDIETVKELLKTKEDKWENKIQLLCQAHDKEKNQLLSQIEKLRLSVTEGQRTSNDLYKKRLDDLDHRLLEQNEFIRTKREQIKEMSIKPTASIRKKSEQGLLYKDNLLFVPPKARNLVLRSVHDHPLAGHGVTKPAGLLKLLRIPDQPWKEIAVDFIVDLPTSHQDKTIMIVVDRLSKMAHCPFPVTALVGPVAVHLELPPSWCVHPTFHVSLLMKWYPDTRERNHHNPPPPLPVVVDGTEEYEIEEILDSRILIGRLEYLVDWRGYCPKECSWVPVSNIHAPAKIGAFHRRHPSRPAPEHARMCWLPGAKSYFSHGSSERPFRFSTPASFRRKSVTVVTEGGLSHQISIATIHISGVNNKISYKKVLTEDYSPLSSGYRFQLLVPYEVSPYQTVQNLENKNRIRLWSLVKIVPWDLNLVLQEIEPLQSVSLHFVSLKVASLIASPLPEELGQQGSASFQKLHFQWIMETINTAYMAEKKIPPSGIRAHSTRAVSTSWAEKGLISLDLIYLDIGVVSTNNQNFINALKRNPSLSKELRPVLKQVLSEKLEYLGVKQGARCIPHKHLKRILHDVEFSREVKEKRIPKFRHIRETLERHVNRKTMQRISSPSFRPVSTTQLFSEYDCKICVTVSSLLLYPDECKLCTTVSSLLLYPDECKLCTTVSSLLLYPDECKLCTTVSSLLLYPDECKICATVFSLMLFPNKCKLCYRCLFLMFPTWDHLSPGPDEPLGSTFGAKLVLDETLLLHVFPSYRTTPFSSDDYSREVPMQCYKYTAPSKSKSSFNRKSSTRYGANNSYLVGSLLEAVQPETIHKQTVKMRAPVRPTLVRERTEQMKQKVLSHPSENKPVGCIDVAQPFVKKHPVTELRAADFDDNEFDSTSFDEKAYEVPRPVHKRQDIPLSKKGNPTVKTAFGSTKDMREADASSTFPSSLVTVSDFSDSSEA
ncbi:LOW QUALITY PROTEIN: cilium assembly protein DZIP1 [Pelodytes ibericus]